MPVLIKDEAIVYTGVKLKRVRWCNDPLRIIPFDMTRLEIAQQVAQIQRRIVTGLELEPWRYRRSGNVVANDAALEKFGLLHIHLRPTHCDQLLWVLQYDTMVTFVEVSGHDPFGDKPPGDTLAKMHTVSARNRELEEDEFLVARRAAVLRSLSKSNADR